MVFLLLHLWPFVAAAAVIGFLAGILGDWLAHRPSRREARRDR